MGRQELEGVLFDDVAGALWTRDLIEQRRARSAPKTLVRVVVGVDPPATAEGDACGIVVCGMDAERDGLGAGRLQRGGAEPGGLGAEGGGEPPRRGARTG